MKETIGVILQAILFIFLRAFSTYVILHIGVLVILMFCKYVIRENNIDVTGHNVICAAMAIYRAFQTTYIINGKKLKLWSDEFGFNKYGDQ